MFSFYLHVNLFFFTVELFAILLISTVSKAFFPNSEISKKKILYAYSAVLSIIPMAMSIDLLLLSLNINPILILNIWPIFIHPTSVSTEFYFTIGMMTEVIILSIVTIISIIMICPHETRNDILKILLNIIVISFIFAIYFIFIVQLLYVAKNSYYLLYVKPLPNTPQIGALKFEALPYAAWLNIVTVLFISPLFFMHEIIHYFKKKMSKVDDFHLVFFPLIPFAGMLIMSLFIIVAPIFYVSEPILYFLFLILFCLPYFLFQFRFLKRSKEYRSQIVNYESIIMSSIGILAVIVGFLNGWSFNYYSTIFLITGIFTLSFLYETLYYMKKMKQQQEQFHYRYFFVLFFACFLYFSIFSMISLFDIICALVILCSLLIFMRYPNSRRNQILFLQVEFLMLFMMGASHVNFSVDWFGLIISVHPLLFLVLNLPLLAIPTIIIQCLLILIHGILRLILYFRKYYFDEK
ncbi:MAG: hypothetical protein ACTSRW_04695 [Candidatus Helarchaeota archaeon]